MHPSLFEEYPTPQKQPPKPKWRPPAKMQPHIEADIDAADLLKTLNLSDLSRAEADNLTRALSARDFSRDADYDWSVRAHMRRYIDERRMRHLGEHRDKQLQAFRARRESNKQHRQGHRLRNGSRPGSSDSSRSGATTAATTTMTTTTAAAAAAGGTRAQRQSTTQTHSRQEKKARNAAQKQQGLRPPPGDRTTVESGAAQRTKSKPRAAHASEMDELARFEHRLKREMTKPMNERDKAWRCADKGIDMPAVS